MENLFIRFFLSSLLLKLSLKIRERIKLIMHSIRSSIESIGRKKANCATLKKKIDNLKNNSWVCLQRGFHFPIKNKIHHKLYFRK